MPPRKHSCGLLDLPRVGRYFSQKQSLITLLFTEISCFSVKFTPKVLKFGLAASYEILQLTLTHGCILGTSCGRLQAIRGIADSTETRNALSRHVKSLRLWICSAEHWWGLRWTAEGCIFCSRHAKRRKIWVLDTVCKVSLIFLSFGFLDSFQSRSQISFTPELVIGILLLQLRGSYLIISASLVSGEVAEFLSSHFHVKSQLICFTFGQKFVLFETIALKSALFSNRHCMLSALSPARQLMATLLHVVRNRCHEECILLCASHHALSCNLR
mmetsp:Transcript_90512/g.142963  ORF Transcript_90512/g.142963 Transcript_90512/m.142963 type:complete len:272 (+) Transcript_90512:353-1168(+)